MGLNNPFIAYCEAQIAQLKFLEKEESVPAHSGK
jgi:hypothetical protein